MEISSTAKGREVIDPGLPDVLEVLMIHTYRSAVSDNGAVDLTKVRTVGQIKQWRETPNGRRTRKIGVENHHPVPEHWAKILYEEVFGRQPPPGWVHEMPGLLMDVRNHRLGDADVRSFHQILDDLLPRNSTRDAAIIRAQLRRAYEEWDPDLGPTIWTVAEEWLNQQGL